MRVEIFSMMSRVERGALGEQALVGLFVVQVGDELLIVQQTGQGA